MRKCRLIAVFSLLMFAFTVSACAKGLVMTILPDNDASEERTVNEMDGIDDSIQEAFDDISLLVLSLGLGVNVVIFTELGMKRIHSTIDNIKDILSNNHLNVDDLNAVISSGFRGSYGSVGFNVEF